MTKNPRESYWKGVTVFSNYSQTQNKQKLTEKNIFHFFHNACNNAKKIWSTKMAKLNQNFANSLYAMSRQLLLAIARLD